MKLFKRLLLFILILLIIVTSIVVINGYNMYKNAINQISLTDKITEIKADDTYVLLDSVPEHFRNAVISVEDRRFEQHGVVDVISIARAIVSNIKSKELREGGSTITQQVAKNIYFITEDDFISRKVAEIFVGIDLEKNYSKNDILELYINTIYFGDGYYGIKEACNGYLNKEPKDMNLDECTLLAGVPNAPSVYAPTNNIDLARSRQKKVISSMVKSNYLTQEESDSLLEEISKSTLFKN